MCYPGESFITGCSSITIGSKGVVVVKGETFQLTPSDVMLFTTEQSVEPPLGFRHKSSIKFSDLQYPRANTCINIIFAYWL